MQKKNILLFIMGEKLYTILVKIGSLVKFEFYAVQMRDDSEKQLHFLRRINAIGDVDACRGALYINLTDNKIGYSYDSAIFTAKIINTKKIGDDNYIFDCVSDDIHWEVIIADADQWEQDGELMFA